MKMMIYEVRISTRLYATPILESYPAYGRVTQQLRYAIDDSTITTCACKKQNSNSSTQGFPSTARASISLLAPIIKHTAAPCHASPAKITTCSTSAPLSVSHPVSGDGFDFTVSGQAHIGEGSAGTQVRGRRNAGRSKSISYRQCLMLLG